MSPLYVSGHLDLTEEEFEEHYVPRLQHAHDHNIGIVVGDARGADQMAQRWLSDRHASEYGGVTVYHMFKKPRHFEDERFYCRGGFTSDSERDIAMTDNSGGDIAWVRPGRESSGTAKNLARRAERKQPQQPIVIAKGGVVRFKQNALVRYLLDNGGLDMNALSRVPCSTEDQAQFAQLIGYPVSGWGSLSYAPCDDVWEADRLAESMSAKEETP